MSEFVEKSSSAQATLETQIDVSKKPLSEISREDIDAITDPDELKRLLLATLSKADELEESLANIDTNGSSKKINSVTEKRDRLEEVRFGLVEMNERMERPYIISSGLASAKTALEVLANKGQMNSIVLEGEPGTGKTQWAYSEVGQEIQDGKDTTLIHVRVKDTMRSQDLLYTVDNIRRLSDAQTMQMPDVIRDEAAEWKHMILSGEVDPSSDEEYKKFSIKMNTVKELGESSKNLDYINYVDLGPLGEAIMQSALGKKVYLLIDEIEKGREELMTGLLDEIENLNFTIEETGHTIKGKKENLRIIITTNTEESDKIPASFRRRSLYHYIDYPTKDEMTEIIKLNYPNLTTDLLHYALDTFYELHNDENLQKKPSTPELLSWIQLLQAEYPNGELPEGVPHKEILIKYSDDNEHIERQEEIDRNAEDVWELLTPAEKQYYLMKDSYDDFQYIHTDDEAVERITASTGLSEQDVIDGLLLLRKDEAKIDAWINGEDNRQSDSDDPYSPYEKYDDES